MNDTPNISNYIDDGIHQVNVIVLDMSFLYMYIPSRYFNIKLSENSDIKILNILVDYMVNKDNTLEEVSSKIYNELFLSNNNLNVSIYYIKNYISMVKEIINNYISKHIKNVKHVSELGTLNDILATNEFYLSEPFNAVINGDVTLLELCIKIYRRK